MIQISDIRQDYIKHQLLESEVSENAIDQFQSWFQDAVTAGIEDVNAFTLSTVGENGTPSARIVLLKGIEQGGFTFYTNYQSDKARALKFLPVAAMTFFWQKLERQVRISGLVSKVSKETSEAYFHSRPRESQIGAWVSPQSKIIPDRQWLEDYLVEMQQKFEKEAVIPLPEHWGGYRLEPMEIEFWQGRSNRLHDRLLYTSVDKGWKIERLAP